MRFWHGFKSTIILTAIIIVILSNSACSSGGSGDVVDSNDTTGSAQGIALSSLAEGGSSASFNALLLEQSQPLSNIGIVLLHGRGGNPDSAVVRQLRNDLYDRGYTTLSIQEAVPAGYAEGTGTTPPFSDYVDDVNTTHYVFPETYARIRSAINYLETNNTGIDKIVLIGFSMGSRLASSHMESGRIDELPVIGLIGVGMYGTSIAPLNVCLTIDGSDVPVLDIYGNNDTDAANTAVARKIVYEGSGIGTTITQLVLTCDPALSTNDCHKLVNLKGTNTSPLEMAVSNWIAGL